MLSYFLRDAALCRAGNFPARGIGRPTVPNPNEVRRSLSLGRKKKPCLSLTKIGNELRYPFRRRNLKDLTEEKTALTFQYFFFPISFTFAWVMDMLLRLRQFC